MLQLLDYIVSIGGSPVLQKTNYTFKEGQTYAIIGQNGSGKSSLALSLMAHPKYTISGATLLDGMDITEYMPYERSERGIYLSFQNVPEIPGITLEEYLRTIYNTHISLQNPEAKPLTSMLFRRIVLKMLTELGMSESFLSRDLNVGFSGGEKRRIELIQIRLLDPKVIILDEIDSGLDLDAIALLSREINILKEKGKTILIISHNFPFLESIDIDIVMLMDGDGKLTEYGKKEALSQIKNSGFDFTST